MAAVATVTSDVVVPPSPRPLPALRKKILPPLAPFRKEKKTPENVPIAPSSPPQTKRQKTFSDPFSSMSGSETELHSEHEEEEDEEEEEVQQNHNQNGNSLQSYSESESQSQSEPEEEEEEEEEPKNNNNPTTRKTKRKRTSFFTTPSSSIQEQRTKNKFSQEYFKNFGICPPNLQNAALRTGIHYASNKSRFEALVYCKEELRELALFGITFARYSGRSTMLPRDIKSAMEAQARKKAAQNNPFFAC